MHMVYVYRLVYQGTADPSEAHEFTPGF